MIDESKKKSIEYEFETFVEQHFEKPANCRTLHQVQFYVKELSIKITEFDSNFNYVPQYAYSLLSEYNLLQNQETSVQYHKYYN